MSIPSNFRSPSPEADFWADAAPAQSYATGNGECMGDLPDNEQLREDQDRLEQLMKEAVEPSQDQKFPGGDWSRQQMRADQERLDELMRDFIQAPDEGGLPSIEATASVEPWQPDGIFDFDAAFNDSITTDPSRRRSQSQPPSARHPPPLLSPINTISSINSVPRRPPQIQRPTMVRSATAVPRRFHPYAGRTGLHQRSYTSHPAVELAPTRDRPVSTRLEATTRISQNPNTSAAVRGSYNFQLYHDQTSLALDLQTQLATLKAQCAAMQEYLAAVFSAGGERGENHARRSNIENKRLCARRANCEITRLNEPLQKLPIHDAEYREVTAPLTGRHIQNLTHEAMDGLLDAFEIYHKPDMFLWEKKAIWLRFVGASKEFMHKVLDG